MRFHRRRVRSSHPRMRLRHVTNHFGARMFGIAAGGLIQNEPCTDLAKELSADARAGAKWIRIDINWAEIQNSGPRRYDWKPIDRVVRAARVRGMRVLGGILYTPSWDRPPGTEATYAPSPASYAKFAAAAARHYRRFGVKAFEIWNEPNSPRFWQPLPSPTAYTALLKAAYTAIKASDPGATVVTGGTAPQPSNGTSYSPVDFLTGIYAAGGKGYFDAVGHHPYCWPVLPGATPWWSAWYQMYGTNPSLRSVMIANGDGAKRIWATEFGAPTDGPPGSYVSEKRQAQMVRRAYELFAHYSWAGPLFFYQGRDTGTNPGTDQNFFGYLSYDFAPKPSYAAYSSMSSAVARSKRR